MNTRDARQIKDLRDVIKFFGFLIAIGLAIVIARAPASSNTALLWSCASLLTGMLLGFLFGIPRVLQGSGQTDLPSAPDPSSEAAANGASTYRQQVNTNLEQISDWLTKIIVGIGLVELRRFPELMTGLARFVSGGFGDTTGSEVFAMALLTYFSVVGFLAGYLITRIYLAGAFSRADIAAQTTIQFAGNEVSIESVSKELSSQIADLREQFLKAASTADSRGLEQATQGEESVTRKTMNVSSLLWVDDTPSNNSVLIDQLRARGIVCETSTSTTDALQKLQGRQFDRIVSDMGRREGTRFNATAGIDLVRAVRANDAQTPIIIYCSAKSAADYRDLALQAGATAITSSPTILLSELDLG